MICDLVYFSCDCIISLTYKQADTALLNGSCNNPICRLVQYTTTGGQCYQVLMKAFIFHWMGRGGNILVKACRLLHYSPDLGEIFCPQL